MRISDWSSDVCSSDLVAADALLAMLSCDILRHRGDRPLRRALGDADIVTAQARARAHVDDRTYATRNHVRQGVPAGAQIAVEIDVHGHVPERSAERRLGKGCVRTLKSWWSPYHQKKKKY